MVSDLIRVRNVNKTGVKFLPLLLILSLVLFLPILALASNNNSMENIASNLTGNFINNLSINSSSQTNDSGNENNSSSEIIVKIVSNNSIDESVNDLNTNISLEDIKNKTQSEKVILPVNQENSTFENNSQIIFNVTLPINEEKEILNETEEKTPENENNTEENQSENVAEEVQIDLSEDQPNESTSLPDNKTEEIKENIPLIVKDEPAQYKIKIGEPVRWSQKIQVLNLGNTSIIDFLVELFLSKDAFNIKIERVADE